MKCIRRVTPSSKKLFELEAQTTSELSNQPGLPGNELVADKMIKKVPIIIKAKAVLYSLVWLIIIPTIPAGIVSFASFAYGCDTEFIIAWFCVVFAPIFFFSGIMNNVQKRLYIAYCLGFRGVKTALILGWDGIEYTPNWGPYPDYFTQRYRLKMFRRH